MAPKVALSHQAYVGILLHAAKHAHQPVNGVLLGSAWQDEISVQRTIPLLHHWTSLSPMMEIGLDLVSKLQAFAYHSNQRVNEQHPNRLSHMPLKRGYR